MLKNWTLCSLTIPSRDVYLRKMLNSLLSSGYNGNIKVLYNCPEEEVKTLSQGIQQDYPIVRTVFYSSEEYGISEGRNKLLSSVETPLIAFLDDDCTLEGENVLGNLEKTLKESSLGLIGLKCFENNSDKLIKPKPKVPQIKINGIIYTQVGGMFGAGYTQLVKDVQGFDEKLKYRMEWMDLNTKIQRAGFTTGIDSESGLVRHWIDAPNSAIRDRKDANLQLFYSLMVLTFKYDCHGQNESSRNLWKRIAEDHGFSSEEILIYVSQIIPQLMDHKREIERDRDFIRSLPFNFMPLEPVSKEDLEKLIECSQRQIQKYKSAL